MGVERVVLLLGWVRLLHGVMVWEGAKWLGGKEAL